jgi:hypothetical protein
MVAFAFRNHYIIPMRDLTNIVSISIHRARKRGEYPVRTEEQAAVLRGFIAWKISNKAKMQARDALLPPSNR